MFFLSQSILPAIGISNLKDKVVGKADIYCSFQSSVYIPSTILCVLSVPKGSILKFHLQGGIWDIMSALKGGM